MFEFTPSELVHLPHELMEFVQLLVSEAEEFTRERRSEKRYRIAMQVNVIPVSEQLRQSGEAFQAVTRDISSRGICLFHTCPVDASFLALQLKEPDGHILKAVMEVLRCRPVASFHEIGGKFVTKIHGAL